MRAREKEREGEGVGEEKDGEKIKCARELEKKRSQKNRRVS